MSDGSTAQAASLCENYEVDGYTDWFLPSQGEMVLMYENLSTTELLSFTNNWYWTSTEQSVNAAMVINPSYGFPDSGKISNDCKGKCWTNYIVRPAREF